MEFILYVLLFVMIGFCYFYREEYLNTKSSYDRLKISAEFFRETAENNKIRADTHFRSAITLAKENSELKINLERVEKNIKFLTLYTSNSLYGKFSSTYQFYLYMSWKPYPDEKPSPAKEGEEIRPYPVAFYHPEIGVVVDMADYHGGWPDPWQLVGDGSPCRPFAWYDLPAPPSAPSQLFSDYCDDRR